MASGLSHGKGLQLLMAILTARACMTQFRTLLPSVVGHINNNDETKHRKGIESLMSWSQDNKLVHNISKMKESVVDIRKREGELLFLSNKAVVEMVDSLRFPDIHITSNQSLHFDAVFKKLHQED